jgi:hypothetical protein
MCWNTLMHSFTLDPGIRLDSDLLGGEVGISGPWVLGVWQM